jgi:hypothetical protein
VSDESRRGGNGFLDMLFFQQKMLQVLGKKVIGLVAWVGIKHSGKVVVPAFNHSIHHTNNHPSAI